MKNSTINTIREIIEKIIITFVIIISIVWITMLLSVFIKIKLFKALLLPFLFSLFFVIILLVIWKIALVIEDKKKK